MVNVQQIPNLPMKFGKFTLKYYDHFDWRIMNFRNQEEYKHIIRKNPAYFDRLVDGCLGNIYSIVNHEEDTVLCFAGFSPSFFESTEAFIFSAKELDDTFCPDIAKAMKYVFDWQKKHYSRIQTACDLEDKIVRWIEWWGFKKECIMPKYGLHGRDRALYSIIV